MPMFSEESHSKNVATARLAVTLVKNAGKDYAYVDPNLAIAKLEQNINDYENAIQDKLQVNLEFRKIIDSRHSVIDKDDLPLKLKQIKNSILSNPLSPEVTERFKSLVDTLNSVRKTESNVPKENQNSVSHSSYESRVSSFAAIVAFLKANNYVSAQTETDIENLEVLVGIMERLNSQWLLAEKNYKEQIIIRDKKYEIVKAAHSKLKQAVKLVEPADSNLIKLLKPLTIQ